MIFDRYLETSLLTSKYLGLLMLSFYEGFEFNFLLRLCPIYYIYIWRCVYRSTCVAVTEQLCEVTSGFPLLHGFQRLELGPLVLPAPLAFCFLHLIVYFMC